MLVLVEQQLDVEQEQQLEQEQLELQAAAASMPTLLMSSISNEDASSSRSSDASDMAMIHLLRGAVRWSRVRAAVRTGRQPPPHPVLVLVEQQLDVEHEQQLEQEQLELHQPAASIPTLLMSSISKDAASSSSSSAANESSMSHLLSWVDDGMGPVRRGRRPRRPRHVVMPVRR